jgi:LPXTG-site transpeptidase (sortase) family protein
LLAFSVGALVAAAILVFLALRPGPDPAAAVLDVDDVVASVTPATVPPLATTPPSSAAVVAPTGPTTTTVPLSPLSALVGERGSALPPAIEPRVRPVGLRIDRIFVDDPVVAVGLEDDGELEVPGADEIGWYQYGAAPGHPGATVLAAHVTWNGEYGPFLNLGELEPGDQVTVDLEDGTERHYEVVERTMYAKDGLPRERIWRNSGDETLVLITCGGDFNPDIHRYRQNIVVYAVPVG